ncbi:MAG: helix-turn-helix transcriptional regulator [Bacteroidales bacterium]|nr:helix-turn-helix transcriptional regulator [Bacteroidales bacterium]
MSVKAGRYPILLLIMIALFCNPKIEGVAGQGIRGHIHLDTTQWAPVAYLSLIPDFNQLYSISRKLMIQEAIITSSGDFLLDINSLPSEDHLYRIHFSKKDDSPASLIIGGVDENHLFLIANNRSNQRITIESDTRLIGRVRFEGYNPTLALQEINGIVGFLDSLDNFCPDMNREFVRDAVHDRLRSYADTCDHPLISLYALYHSGIDTDAPSNRGYLRSYFRKWRGGESDYFRVFRSQLANYQKPNVLIAVSGALTALLLGAGGLAYYRRRKQSSRNPYQSLTVQERKVFSLIREGRSNKEISEICSISLSTVKSHVNSIYSKLRLTSRTDVMDYPDP